MLKPDICWHQAELSCDTNTMDSLCCIKEAGYFPFKLSNTFGEKQYKIFFILITVCVR